MKIMKKAIPLFLSVVLAASFAACGGNAGNGATQSTAQGSKEVATAATTASSTDAIAAQPKFPLSEPVTMTMMAILNGISLDQTTAMKKMETMTNVKWKVEAVAGSEIGEKRNLLLASNQYPDVFMKTWLDGSTLDKYGRQGIFISLNELINKNAPNLTKLFNERAGVKNTVTSGDGNIYALPEIDTPSVGSQPLFINKAWLDKLGLKMPTNSDELYTVLLAFKTGDPNGNGKADEIPFIANDGNPVTLLEPYFGISNFSDKTIIDGKLQYLATTDKYKEFLKYCRKLYKDGLLAKDAFTMKQEQQIAIGSSGDTLGCFFDAGAFLTVGRDRDTDFPALMPFEKGIFPTSTGAAGGTFAITDKCKYPDIAVAWADQWYSEEGGRLAWMGVENENYKINADGSWDWVLGSFKDIGTLRQAATIQGAATHSSVMPELWSKNTSDVNEVKITTERANIVAAGAKPFPTLNYAESDSKTIASITADVNPYVSQYVAEIVTGRKDIDSSWDIYLSTLNKMGLDQLVSIYTKAYEAATK